VKPEAFVPPFLVDWIGVREEISLLIEVKATVPSNFHNRPPER
jgi:hypothetical protein